MTWWLALSLLLALITIGGAIWRMGRDHGRKNLIEEQAKAKQQELRADAKTTEAEIYARPRGDKSSVIDRL